MYIHVHNVYVYINEPQLLWLRTAIYHAGLDVKMKVTQCAGRVSANTRLHQLRWVTGRGRITCHAHITLMTGLKNVSTKKTTVHVCTAISDDSGYGMEDRREMCQRLLVRLAPLRLFHVHQYNMYVYSWLTMIVDVVWKPEEKCVGNKLVKEQSQWVLNDTLGEEIRMKWRTASHACIFTCMYRYVYTCIMYKTVRTTYVHIHLHRPNSMHVHVQCNTKLIVNSTMPKTYWQCRCVYSLESSELLEAQLHSSGLSAKEQLFYTEIACLEVKSWCPFINLELHVRTMCIYRFIHTPCFKDYVCTSH